MKHERGNKKVLLYFKAVFLIDVEFLAGRKEFYVNNFKVKNPELKLVRHAIR